MFSSSSPLFKNMEKAYELNKDVVVVGGEGRAKSVASVEKGTGCGMYEQV